MSMTLYDFLLRLFLGFAVVFGIVVFICLVAGWFRSYWARRYNIRCRICGFRFYKERENPRAECPHCGAINKKG